MPDQGQDQDHNNSVAEAVRALAAAMANLDEARLALVRAERSEGPGPRQTAFQGQRVRLERASREVRAVAAMVVASST